MDKNPFKFSLRDEVEIVDLNRPAIIDAMMIESAGTKYRVCFWYDGQRSIEWVYENEIRLRQK